MKNEEKIQLRIPEELKQNLETIANSRRVNLSYLVRDILVNYIEEKHARCSKPS